VIDELAAGIYAALLAPMMRDIIEFLASSKEPDYGITEGIKALLVNISGAQIERLK
jgi:hypothetical protein